MEENERKPMPDATLETLYQYFPSEVSDVREASEARIAEAEKMLATRFFMRPELGRRVLSPTEESAMAHVAQGRGWVDAARVDPHAEAQAREEQNAAVLSQEAANWKASRKGGSR